MTERNKEDKPNDHNGATEPPYRGANGRETGERLIRCLHTDDQRPPLSDDVFEFHWRCSAVFESTADELPYCPLHRHQYRNRTERMPTLEERREMARQLTPKAMAFLRSCLPPKHPILDDLPPARVSARDAWPFPGAAEDKEDETPERLAAADARRATLKAQAEQLSTDHHQARE